MSSTTESEFFQNHVFLKYFGVFKASISATEAIGYAHGLQMKLSSRLFLNGAEQALVGENIVDPLAVQVETSILLYTLWVLERTPRMASFLSSDHFETLRGMAQVALSHYRACQNLQDPSLHSLKSAQLLLLMELERYSGVLTEAEGREVCESARLRFASTPNLCGQLEEVCLLNHVAHQHLAHRHFELLIKTLSAGDPHNPLMGALEELIGQYRIVYFPERVFGPGFDKTRSDYVWDHLGQRWGLGMTDYVMLISRVYEEVMDDSFFEGKKEEQPKTTEELTRMVRPGVGISQLILAARDVWFVICESGLMVLAGSMECGLTIGVREDQIAAALLSYTQLVVLLEVIRGSLMSTDGPTCQEDDIQQLLLLYREIRFWEERFRLGMEVHKNEAFHLISGAGKKRVGKTPTLTELVTLIKACTSNFYLAVSLASLHQSLQLLNRASLVTRLSPQTGHLPYIDLSQDSTMCKAFLPTLSVFKVVPEGITGNFHDHLSKATNGRMSTVMIILWVILVFVGMMALASAIGFMIGLVIGMLGVA